MHSKQSSIYFGSIDIIDILHSIDDKIAALHQCSSEDFLSLNAHFKNWYKNSKSLTNNAKIIFENFSSLEVDNINNQVFGCKEICINQKKCIEEDGIQILDEYNMLLLNLNNLKVLFNNILQDISTLKLIATNNKIEFTHIVKKKQYTSQNEHLLSNADTVCSLIKKSLKSLDLHIKKTDISNHSWQNEYALIKRSFQNRKNIWDAVFSHLKLMQAEMTEQRLKFEEKSFRTEESISNIITNLQFHDIIRQKIEHIQQTHEEILLDLNKLKDGNDNDKEVFERISGITAIQTAQLIYTNDEYQKAIENISTMFSIIKEDSNFISRLQNAMASFGSDLDSNYLSALIYHLTQLINIEVYPLRENFLFDDLNAFCFELRLLIKELAGLSKILIEATIEMDSSINNKEVNRLLIDKELKLNILVGNIEKILTTVKCKIKDGSLNMPDCSDIKLLISELNTKEKVLQKLLCQNVKLNDKIAVEINESISNIKYYDFFQKEIEQIIEMLNKINSQVILTEEDIALNKHNLNYLKSKYTMDSEFKIHDRITKKNISMDSEDVVNKTDEENLELF